ncbi:MAG: hypothetical protein KDD92_15660 [Caldilineaceae bacterium]|nr:hypothetical protein [Caldilineaceae bacterium]
MSKQTTFVLVMVGIVLTVGLTLLGASRLLADPLASGNIPELMSYQGYATDAGGNALDGSYDMTFKIYDSSSGGTKYWEESHSGVSVNGGYFAVMLGSNGAPLSYSAFEGESRYVEVTIGADSPLSRQRIGAVPYALQAYKARTAVEATYAMTATVALNGSGGYEHVIVVAKSGGDYTSVADALNSIAGPSSSSRYLVYVAPGTYTESNLVEVKEYVHLQGAGPNITSIVSARSDSSSSSSAATAVLRDKGRISDLAIYNDATSDTAIGIYMGGDATRGAILDNVVIKARGNGGSAHYAVYLNDAEPTIKRSWLSATGAAGTTSNIGLGSRNENGGFPQALIRNSVILGGIDDNNSCTIQVGIGMKLTESSPAVEHSYICGGRRAVLLETNGFPTIEHSTARVSSTFGAYLVETTAGGIVSFGASKLQYFDSGQTGLNTGAGSRPRCAAAYDYGVFSELNSGCEIP